MILDNLATWGQLGSILAILIAAFYLKRTVRFATFFARAVGTIILLLILLAVSTAFGWVDIDISQFIQDLSDLRMLLDVIQSLLG